MKSLLAVDVGNSYVKYGLFVDGALVETRKHQTARSSQFAATCLAAHDARVAVSSVVPAATAVILDACKRLNRPFVQIHARSQKVLRGMNRHMGADRVADAVAAWQLYGNGKPVVVMGFGTGTTLLALTAEGAVAGGWIAPGVQPTLEVLHQRCALLPLLEMEGQSDKLGHDTESHMRNGVFLGHVGLAREWLSAAKRSLGGNVVSVATGGWSAKIQEHDKIFDFVDSELTLKGINLIAGRVRFNKPTSVHSR